ncbi:MAG TPA: hypothetical protein VIY86_04535, partial [Pirellulaceae bacterium]
TVRRQEGIEPGIPGPPHMVRPPRGGRPKSHVYICRQTGIDDYARPTKPITIVQPPGGGRMRTKVLVRKQTGAPAGFPIKVFVVTPPKIRKHRPIHRIISRRQEGAVFTFHDIVNPITTDPFDVRIKTRPFGTTLTTRPLSSEITTDPFDTEWKSRGTT